MTNKLTQEEQDDLVYISTHRNGYDIKDSILAIVSADPMKIDEADVENAEYGIYEFQEEYFCKLLAKLLTYKALQWPLTGVFIPRWVTRYRAIHYEGERPEERCGLKIQDR